MPFHIIKGDITRVEADALVNAASNRLKEGGGVCGAIFSAAGREQMARACDAIGFCPPGGAVMTPAFELNAKYVIHAVGPVYLDGLQGEPETLKSAYHSALRLAQEKGLRSIAFPLISSGIYGYPREEALDIATGAILEFLRQDEDEMHVTLVLFDGKAIHIDEKTRREIGRLISLSAFSQAENLMSRRRNSRDRAFLEEGAEKYLAAEPEEMADSDIPESPALPTRGDEVSFHEWMVPIRFPSTSLENLIKRQDEGFSVTLLRLIDQKGKHDVEVYKRANMDRKLFSKIRGSSDYTPSKKTVLALAIALELNRQETEDLLDRAGYSLSPSRKFDIIIGYFIDRGSYDIYAINDVLFFYDQPLLGA